MLFCTSVKWDPVINTNQQTVSGRRLGNFWFNTNQVESCWQLI